MNDEIFFEGQKMLTISEAASRSNLSIDYLRRLARRGLLTIHDISGKRFVAEPSLLEYLSGREREAERAREELSRRRAAEYRNPSRASLGLPQDESLVDFGSAAARVGLSVDYIQRLAKSGAIKAREVGDEKLVESDSLHVFALNRAHREAEQRGQIRIMREREYMLAHLPLHEEIVAFATDRRTFAQFTGIFVERAVALTLAAVLILGTYAVLDPRAATRAVHATEALVGDPGTSLAAAASLWPNSLASLAQAFHTTVNDFVYAIAFPPQITSSGATVAVDIAPYARPVAQNQESGMTNYESAPHLARTPHVQNPNGAQTIIQNPVTERVIERVIETRTVASVGGISEEYLAAQLSTLDGKLSNQMLALSSANSTTIVQNYGVTAQTNKIDELNDVEINNPTITGGTMTGTAMSGGSISGTSISASGLSVSGTTMLNATEVAGDLTLEGNLIMASSSASLSAINAAFTNATSTNLFATTASSTNLFATSATSSTFFATTLRATSGTFDGLSVTGASSFGGLLAIASSTIGDGNQAGGLTIFGGATTTGNAYFVGGLGVGVATTTPGVLQTSGNAHIGGNLLVMGNSTTLGATSLNTLTINSSINSSIVPNQNITYDLGSPSFYWRNVYVGNIVANNISAASTTIAGTASATFTINSDNVSSDGEDADLIFFRGNVVPNALLSWKTGTKRFEFNQAAYIQNQSGSTTQPTLRLHGIAGQTGNIFQIASSTGTNIFTVASDGSVTISTSTITALTSGTSTITNLSVTNTSTSSFAGPVTFGTNYLNIISTGQVVLGSATASSSALFQLDSTTRGFLPPRLTTIQKNAITSPSSGLILYDADLNKLNVYNGSAWKNVGSTEIGGEVTNGTQGSVLFIGDGTVLGQDATNFSFSTSSNRLFLTQASTTRLSNFSTAYFGGSATTTIDSAGNVAIAGTLGVSGNTTLANATSTNFFATTASSTSLYSQAASVGSFTASGATTLASATSTNFFATTASSTSLYSQAASLGALSAGTLVISSTLNLTGLATLASGFVSQASSTVVGNFTTTGNGYFGGSVGIGTTTPGSILSVQGVANFTTATSTFYASGGINITSGCFAINSTCLSVNGGPLAVYATSSVGTTTVQFTGTANSAPSYSNGVLTLPSNTVYATFEIWGAGGGGGASTDGVNSGTNGGGGGGGGGYATKLMTALNSSYTFSLGAGGGPQGNGSGSCVSAGAVACASAVISATGGGAGGTSGSNYPAIGGIGGTGSGGDVNLVGSAGATSDEGVYGTTGSGGGSGGSAPLGGGGGRGGSSTGPLVGSPFGGGGGGASGFGGNSGATGGAGGFKITVYTTMSGASLSGGQSQSPTNTTFTSGSGTYTVPPGVSYLRVRMVGGGAGGSAGGNGGGVGTAGGNTTFGTSLLVAGGGQPGGSNIVGGPGGTASGGNINVSGGSGTGTGFSVASTASTAGGAGGSSALGGAGGATNNAAGGNAAVNSGSGGAGGGASSGGTVVAAAGGGAGGYVETIIVSPSSSYSYAVGTGGTGNASPGGSGYAGGNGAAGQIVIDEFYGSASSGVVGAGVGGQFAFYNATGATLSATSSIFVATSTSMIGIGTTTPWARLSVTSPGQQSGSLSLFSIASTTGASLFTVLGNGGVGIGTTTNPFGGELSAGLTIANALVIASSTNLSTTTSALYNKNGTLYFNGTAVGTGVGGSGGGQLIATYATSSVGTTTVSFAGAANSAPSFSNGALTLPSNTSYVVVEVWGAGGGGGGAGNGGAGTAGGITCFGTNATACSSPTLQATGGTGGFGFNSGGGTGGTGSGGDVNLVGGPGDGQFAVTAGNLYATGGTGGSAPLGGTGGTSNAYNANGSSGNPFGGGGSGGSINGQDGLWVGSGGGSGGYSRELLTSLNSSYTFTVAAGGSGGTAGTGGGTGGAGGAGGVVISVYTSGVSQGSIGAGAAGYLPYFTSDTASTSLSATSSIFLSSASYVGIGTTTPWAKLSVSASNNSSAPQFVVASSTAIGFMVAHTGNVSFGGMPTTNKLTIHWNPTSQQGIVLRSSNETYNGAPIYFQNSSDGIAGNITQSTNAVSYNTSSDRRFKENITPTALGLDALMQLPVHDFSFITDSTHATTSGFLAQELHDIFPWAVTTNGDDGTIPLSATSTGWSVDYGRITPLLVKAVQDLNLKVESLTEALPEEEEEESESFAARFMTQLYASLTAWFADAANGIEEFFAGTVRTNELCVADDTGETCVSRAQLDALLAGAAESSSGEDGGEGGGTEGEADPPIEGASDTTAPVITITGANPATVHVGDTYSDLGASIFDEASPNIGVSVVVDGGATTTIEMISIDTSAPGTHTIIYSATDQAGNTGTAERTVNVVPIPSPFDGSTPDEDTNPPTPEGGDEPAGE